jgi:hypothetical protein
MSQNSSRARLLAIIGALGAAIWSFSGSSTSQSYQPPVPILPGRNNTVLFITSDMSGLSNVHVATSFTLMEEHPEVEVHYATFPKLQKVIERTSAEGLAANRAAKPIKFHAVRGKAFMQNFVDRVGNLTELRGIHGMQKKLRDISKAMFPYTNEEYTDIYAHLVEIVDEVDPAVIVIDAVFRGSLDLVQNVKSRRYITMSPNALLDLVADKQGLLNYFWKYPS